MGSREFLGYCSFTKAIDHLGDRWSLLIVRELGMFGPQGFNDLAAALPGRISRSVLADRLRRLETLGLVSRGRDAAYQLTVIGSGLIPVLQSLRAWADTWLPDDPDMLERDPDVVLGWLARRIDSSTAPGRPVVLELRVHYRHDHRYWLVVQRDAEAYGCLTDPFLDVSRYVYVESSMPALLALARGRRDWADALVDGSVTAAGDPQLLNRVGEWFRPAASSPVMDMPVSTQPSR